MSEDLTAQDLTKPKSARDSAGQLWVDLGPILIFVVTYNVLFRIQATKDEAIYIATGVFIAAVLAAIAWCKLQRGKIPPILIVTGVLVTAFGGLTIIFHDPAIIQIKFTFTFLFYATAILISLAIKQNVWKLFFQHLFNLPDRIWTVLALRWAAFYVVVALLNEVLRYNFNEANGNFDVWLNLRTALTYPAFIIFAALNTPLVLKHHRETPEPDGAPAAPSS
ncbi:MAG TPA: septation protein IspZ [Vitreimonas sp.]|uniref:inner membrane-spanning protein YciB n=1 Tax=Vitreimonas sp. TaxID=3069702 RepID=UPI002D693A48|nr:septation protein IspZ [Vitreimonas sp.]HYD88463.1 septation protein IspZ [Vitreimonas sp.]